MRLELGYHRASRSGLLDRRKGGEQQRLYRHEHALLRERAVLDDGGFAALGNGAHGTQVLSSLRYKKCTEAQEPDKFVPFCPSLTLLQHD